MNLFINGSNRKQNCYQILKDLKNPEDILISLSDKKIEYCLGCTKCQENQTNTCIIQDDMISINKNLEKTNHIVIASPIYFNQITARLKNMIDRLNPYTTNSVLKGKTIYLITIGSMSEEDNISICQAINEYFTGLCEIFSMNFVYLKNFTSEVEDNILKTYSEYPSIISDLKKEIKN